MANEIEIYLNYASAKNKANELERLAMVLKRIANNSIPGDLSTVEKNWKGDAARQYIHKGKLLCKNILDEAKSLITVANTIRVIAKRTYDSEMNALQIARKRSYK